jgi:hypothetical protein
MSRKYKFKVGDLVVIKPSERATTRAREAGVLRIKRFDDNEMTEDTVADVVDEHGRHVAGRYLYKLIRVEDVTPDLWKITTPGLEAFGLQDASDIHLRQLEDADAPLPKLW